MKKVLLFIAFVLVAITGMSQANVVSGAISVQGIARDANSNAVPNTPALPISAELYYLNNNSPVSIELKTGTVTTDAFGVFAYVMEISPSSFIRISNTEAWIRISSGSVTFANEKLRMVPYAIHAQNGVPTGTIMAFAGNPNAVPQGWLLCDGRAIPSDAFHAALRSILGNNGVDATNVPDLRGMFLRGAGTNGNTAYANNIGPAVRVFQADSVVSHVHPLQGNGNASVTDTTGLHRHWYFTRYGSNGNWQSMLSGVGYNGVWADPWTGPPTGGSQTSSEGQHSHRVWLNGNTATNNNSRETRPVNYGVHYIIKI
jgi:microcystin-dependent protein